MWDDETDVIVAGSGGGLVGAYTAAREGLSVKVVEASDQFGGTTAYSGGGGMWFPCNPVLRRAGSDDTLDAAFAYFHAVVGDRTPVELQRTYVYGGSDLIAYLEARRSLRIRCASMAGLFRRVAARAPRRSASHRDETASRATPRRAGAPGARAVGQRTARRRRAEVPHRRAGADRQAAVGDHRHIRTPRCISTARWWSLVTSSEGVVGAVVEAARPSPRNPRPRRCAARGGRFREQSRAAPALRRAR